LLDRWLNLPSLIRQVALGVYVVGAAAYILFAMVRPLMRQINPYYAARKVEQFVPGAKNSVINWLDLRDRKLPPAIRGAVGQRAARDLGKADLDQALSGRRARWLGLADVLLVLALTAAIVVLTPKQFWSFL